MILPGALKPEEAELVTPELLARAISVLRGSFRYVVVDLGVALSDSMLAVIDQLQHMILVVTPEISALKASGDALQILLALGTSSDQITVALNHRSPKAPLPRPTAERMLGRGVDVEIMFDGSRADEAAVRGSILSLTDPKSEVTKSAEALADLIEFRHPPQMTYATGGDDDVAADPAPLGADRGSQTW
jgi:pilus assembly protein CpaE